MNRQEGIRKDVIRHRDAQLLPVIARCSEVNSSKDPRVLNFLES
jgi:hypothetical protein